MTDRRPSAPPPPSGSLSLAQVIYQSALMTPFKLHDLEMTEEDMAYCASLARKLTGEEANWLLRSFQRFFIWGRVDLLGSSSGPAPREMPPR
jgi:hypothetical protein